DALAGLLGQPLCEHAYHGERNARSLPQDALELALCQSDRSDIALRDKGSDPRLPGDDGHLADDVSRRATRELVFGSSTILYHSDSPRHNDVEFLPELPFRRNHLTIGVAGFLRD